MTLSTLALRAKISVLFTPLNDFVRLYVWEDYLTVVVSFLFCSCLPAATYKIHRQIKVWRAQILEKSLGRNSHSVHHLVKPYYARSR